MKRMFLTVVVIASLTLPARGQDQPPGPSQEEQDEALQNAADAVAAAAQEEECGVENPPASCMQKHFFNAKPYKLIYDENCGGGKWVRVNYEECPIAFDDPEFSHHEYMCKGGSSPLCGAETEGMWTWPEYGYCSSVAVCLACPKLRDCDEWAAPPHEGGSSTTIVISTTNTGVHGGGVHGGVHGVEHGGQHQIIADQQRAKLLDLLTLIRRGEKLSSRQLDRLQALSATATWLDWMQKDMIRDVLDHHHELQNLLDLARRGVSLSVSEVRRVQTLAAEVNLTFEENIFIQTLVVQISSSSHGGWQGGHGGHHQVHGQGLHGGQQMEEMQGLLNRAESGALLERQEVRRMLNLASILDSSLDGWQRRIIRNLRSQINSSSASHFSFSGSSSSSFSNSHIGQVQSGSQSSHHSSQSTHHSSQSSHFSSGSVGAWSDRFRRSSGESGEASDKDDEGDEKEVLIYAELV